MSTLFDPACYGLAEYFLRGIRSVERKAALAGHIQDAIEDWLSEHEACDRDCAVCFPRTQGNDA